MSTHGDGGKGSERRPGQRFGEGWDRIFGNKPETCPKCGSEAWDRIEHERGREGQKPFNRCWPCEHEWTAK